MSQDLNGFKQNITKSEWRMAKLYKSEGEELDPR